MFGIEVMEEMNANAVMEAKKKQLDQRAYEDALDNDEL
jgi:hypothetical protein